MQKLNKLTNKRLFQSIFYSFNIFTFILLLLPAIKININLWWLDNLLNLQIQWSLLAFILILINTLYIKKLTLLVITLYTTVIIYNLIPLYITLPIRVMKAAKNINYQQQLVQLTIAQLNLSYENPNLKQLLPILGDNKFDLLVIQEASDEEHKNIKNLAQYYPYSFGLEPTAATPSGMAIFSRWPIINKQIHYLGYKSGHILEAIIEMPGSVPMQLYSLHPGSPRTKKLWQLRNQTLATIADKVAASAFMNKVVIGDFNSSPWSSSFRHLQKHSKLNNSANGFGYFPSWSYSEKPLLSILSSAYIDHSLVSPAIKVTNKYSQTVKGSDHLLLITELTVVN